MTRNLILSGGVAHDYGRTSDMLAEILERGGVESEISEEPAVLERPAVQDFDLLTLNCVRWSCAVTPEWKDWAFEINAEQRNGLLRFVGAGKGIMALHAAIINFDTWPEYGQILGGYWKWGESSHAPYQSGYEMHVADRHHPITQGIKDFQIHDELYHTLRITRTVSPILFTLWEERLQPMAWTTEYGSARIYYNALGHGPESFQCKDLQSLLIQGALWSSRRC